MDKLTEQLAEALRELRYACTDKAERMTDAALAAYDAAKANETRLTETTGRAAGIAHERVQPVTAGETAQQEAAKANGGWLPIESAPKDGTRIIALSVDGDICCAEWRRISYGRRTRAIYGWYVPYSDHDEQGGAISLDSLLWQPLPPPPEQMK